MKKKSGSSKTEARKNNPFRCKSLIKYITGNAPGCVIRAKAFLRKFVLISVVLLIICSAICVFVFADENVYVDVYKYSDLTEVHISQETNWIQDKAFLGNETVEKVFIPSGVKCIGEQAFANCPNLKEVYIEDGVNWENCSPNAFWNCPQLTELHLPIAGEYLNFSISLEGCDSFKKLVVPDGYVLIDTINIPSLERIEIPASVRTIYFEWVRKMYTPRLAEIYVDPANPVFSSKDNCLIYNKHSIALMGCNVNKILEDEEIGLVAEPNGTITPWALCADNFRIMKVPSNILFFDMGNVTFAPDVIYLEENTIFSGGVRKPTEVYYNGTMSNAFNHIRNDAFVWVGGGIVHCTDGDIHWESVDPRGYDINDVSLDKIMEERGWLQSPGTGDSGVIWVAAVSVLSLLGACILIRKRAVLKNKQ